MPGRRRRLERTMVAGVRVQARGCARDRRGLRRRRRILDLKSRADRPSFALRLLRHPEHRTLPCARRHLDVDRRRHLPPSLRSLWGRAAEVPRPWLHLGASTVLPRGTRVRQRVPEQSDLQLRRRHRGAGLVVPVRKQPRVSLCQVQQHSQIGPGPFGQRTRVQPNLAESSSRVRRDPAKNPRCSWSRLRRATSAIPAERPASGLWSAIPIEATDPLRRSPKRRK